MSVTFQPRSGPIILEVEVAGPRATFKARMILDTGATTTSLRLKVLRLIGYDPSMAVGHAQLITGSADSTVALLMVNRLQRTGPARDWIADARPQSTVPRRRRRSPRAGFRARPCPYDRLSAGAD